MTTKQPPAQKHLEMAERIVNTSQEWIDDDNEHGAEAGWIYSEAMLKEKIATALSQVETEALASKVVGPSESAIETASMRDFGNNRKDNKEKYCTNNDFYMAVTSSFIRGAKWALSKITLAPNEQVISPDIDKKEISGDMDNCVCDETHIHNCPVHTHLQDEPEVKAQGFEEWWDRSGLENEWRDTWSKLHFEECYKAGQKSIRGQVKLPDAVYEGFVCCPTGKMKQNTITTMELETFILSNCETAYPYRCEFYKLPESGTGGE